jgi:secondary thiamine-phosphate synthase enzyme
VVFSIAIKTTRQGLHEITPDVVDVVMSPPAQSALAPDRSGLCTVFIRHTSASLIIQENADPSARHDLERWLNNLVPESGPTVPRFTHTSEGPDDMPSHIKAALTATSLSIPIVNGRLGLGTWQGIYLWEHRTSPHNRQVLIHVGP